MIVALVSAVSLTIGQLAVSTSPCGLTQPGALEKGAIEISTSSNSPTPKFMWVWKGVELRGGYSLSTDNLGLARARTVSGGFIIPPPPPPAEPFRTREARKAFRAEGYEYQLELLLSRGEGRESYSFVLPEEFWAKVRCLIMPEPPADDATRAAPAMPEKKLPASQQKQHAK